jgi:hypothetical protein
MPFAYCFQGGLRETLLLYRTSQTAWSFFTAYGKVEFLKIVALLTHQALDPIDVVFF